ncbi:molybdopterin biosynthesis protein MoeA/LysR substrate binding-domain-containing protein [Haloferax mucosum ATCC BAA-1512]|uniref:Molybdopterin biosynthesis protein MoeA/LysR substrate binding-domain-containing protein n=1 Tax=Haloferax mucosum ATCC BAA-1512 TaxID=662479 RepID=M0ILI5_9EURY|nr:molybdopterin biosynthesis protein [Haloferax mucosum]ELZ96897.1 molybdopterin biosynthesis protein MoeA/LysR substrate binding-domain-containing protein [Haloferax mucosum ATCC BAA-1512]
MRKQFRDLASPEEARETIASLDVTPDSETVPLSAARGRVLAERIDAGMDVPGFDRASMDGYAVRARDTFGADEADPVELELVGEVHAGSEPDVEVTSGTAVEISTGAVMPPGADAVVIVERTDERDGSLLTYTSVAPGDSVMSAGTDIAAGARALGPGTRLTPREIGLLSALGIDDVPVRGRPVVGIVSTGDELVRPGDDLRPEAGEIYDVNSYTIAAGVDEAGGVPKLYPHAGDDYDEMERLLRQAADECDLVLSSGSTSASAVDVIYRVVEERGELLLHGVSVKPGKPMLVGTLGEGGAYIGLPGYPVSALTIFRTFAAPAIRAAAGLPEPRMATVEGSMAVRERYAEGRTRLMPVGLVTGSAPSTGDSVADTRNNPDDTASERLVYPVDKGSGATTSLVEADGVVEIPADVEYLAEGESVTVQLFSPDVRPPELLGVGEDDPALSRLLDRVPSPRYLPFGSREGLRRLRNGIPDVAVVAGEYHGDDEAVELGSWTREWGLVVPADNPDGVTGLESLVDDDLRFVNRDTNSGLRTELGNALAALAEARDVTRHELVEAIEGFENGAKAFESPPRAVRAGNAAVGLGLRETAAALELGFVSLGDQRVRVLANPDRTGKRGVQSLGDALDRIDDVLDGLTGFEKV